MRLHYSADDICRIVRLHAAEHNPFRPGHAESAELVVRDDDGGAMTDDCTVTVEVELGEIVIGDEASRTGPQVQRETQ